MKLFDIVPMKFFNEIQKLYIIMPIFSFKLHKVFY